MKYYEKYILKQYEKRRNAKEFQIEWSSRGKKESEKFNKAIKTFLQNMKVNKEITRFQNCSINGDYFNILSQPKIFPNLKEINFYWCKIISFESFDMFISKRTRVGSWWYIFLV
eukprot:maker-scaffold_37-snap-gene-2.2-mRNA-1 protein AED:0.07 eAED:0.07 QI:39/0.66/0.71/1/0/0/7/274/113